MSYCDKFITYDIETTTIISGVTEDMDLIRDGIIYSGQFYDGEDYIQVRTPAEIRQVFNLIRTQADLDADNMMCVFVHNLSYEFQFLKNDFHWTRILASSERRIIMAECAEGFSFRCSYILSNMSLEKFLENEEIPYQKLSMDYEKKRFPWTELTEDEKEYCKIDVVGLWYAIEKRIADCYRGSIAYLPLTSTSYVRRDCRRAVKKNHKNRIRFTQAALSPEEYRLCHAAFRGGNCHANRIYAGSVQKQVASFDKASSYPFEMLTKRFPDKFFRMKKYSLREFEFFYSRPDRYALLMRVMFIGIRLKDGVPVPYISTHRCLNLSSDQARDNGRLLSCGYCEIALTELDLAIIQRQYDFDQVRFAEVYYAKKTYLPEELCSVILDYYQQKTSLKGIPEKSYEYGKSKNRLNGIYGMCVTNPLQQDFVYDPEIKRLIPDPDQKTAADLLEAFYSNRQSFLSYQWGVWVTAYARYDLQELIDLVGMDTVYADTDSVKFINPDRHLQQIREINERIRAEAAARGAVAEDRKGNKKYMGVWEDEGTAPLFKTFGAKKYIYGDNEDFKITISGVPKKAGKEYVKKWMQETGHSWTDIRQGFVFRGIKLTSEYHDYQEPRKFYFDGKQLEITSNLGLYPANYTLGYSTDYELLLRSLGREDL